MGSGPEEEKLDQEAWPREEKDPRSRLRHPSRHRDSWEAREPEDRPRFRPHLRHRQTEVLSLSERGRRERLRTGTNRMPSDRRRRQLAELEIRIENDSPLVDLGRIRFGMPELQELKAEDEAEWHGLGRKAESLNCRLRGCNSNPEVYNWSLVG